MDLGEKKRKKEERINKYITPLAVNNKNNYTFKKRYLYQKAIRTWYYIFMSLGLLNSNL